MKLATLILVLLLGACDCAEGVAHEGSEVAPRRTLAVIPKGTTHEFWKSIHAGANKAARELDVDILWQGPVREDDRDAQVRVVENMVSRRVDGIVLAPLDDTALVPAVRDAHSEGIPVVIIDSGINWNDRVSFVATDNRRGGVLGAERLAALLEGSGHVILLRYQEGSASTALREEGFLATVRERFPNIEVVVDNRYGGATTETAYAASENLLLSHPEVDGVFCPNESTTFGMLRALQDSGKAGQIKFVGFDSSDRLARALEDGELHGLVLQNPFLMGELGVRMMVEHLEGREAESRVDTGVVMVTPENMAQPEIRQLLHPDLAVWLSE